MRGKGVYYGGGGVKVKVKGGGRVQPSKRPRTHAPSFYFIILLYFEMMRFDFRSSQRVPHPPTRPFVVPLHFTTTPTLTPLYSLDLLILLPPLIPLL